MIPEEQSGGITSLPRLYFTSNFMKHKEGLPIINDPNDIKCNICEMEDADSFCQDCHEFYCERCQRGHKKSKSSKSHKFISVDDGWKFISGSGTSESSSSASSPTARSTHCLIHPHLEINTFCKTDQELICPECIASNHSGHIFTKLEKMAVDFKNEILPKLIEVFLSFSVFLSSATSILMTCNKLKKNIMKIDSKEGRTNWRDNQKTAKGIGRDWWECNEM